MTAWVSSPVFIGRAGELDQLDRAMSRAASGTPSIVLVGGEAGIGKSRLVAAAVAVAASRDVTGLGRAQLDALESTYRLMLADIEVAMVSHDARGIARHRAEFETLCKSGTLTGLLQDCDADLATVMR